MGSGTVTAAQVRKIYITARERGVDNDLLHEHIERLVKKDSIKLLTKEEAAEVIDSLEGKPHTGKDAMTQKQRLYLLALAKKLGWTDGSGKVDEKRLNGMCGKYAKVSRYEWLTRSGASRLIEALKNMASKLDMEAEAETDTKAGQDKKA